MGRDSELNIATFRAALLDEARREARERLEQAEQAAQRKLDGARQERDRLVENARRDGRDSAERETRRRRSAARREARARVLRARREALERLRERTLQRLRNDRGRAFMKQLEAMARKQLGDTAQIEPDKEAGGLIARCDGRVVDYRTPAVVDRAIEDLGAELETLWQ